MTNRDHDRLACLPARVSALDVAAHVTELIAVDGLELVFWDGCKLPERHDEVGFVVPPDLFRRPELLTEFGALEVVQTVSAAVDRVLPHLPTGVTLCSANGVHGGSVAEWVLGAVLGVLREIPAFAAEQHRGRWNTRTTDELAGRRALVIGAGDLGRAIARRLDPFDVAVTLVGRRSREGVRAISELPALLTDADIGIVVVPLTGDTRGMVDASFLAAMPDGAMIVNAARGPVVDTGALLAELQAGRLRAILDVTDPEPLPPEHPLWLAPGVLVTPHVAGNVPGFPGRALALINAQLQRWVAGEPLVNVVSGSY